MAAEPQTSPSVAHSTQLLLEHSWPHTPWCWQQPSPAMQVHPHSTKLNWAQNKQVGRIARFGKGMHADLRRYISYLCGFMKFNLNESKQFWVKKSPTPYIFYLEHRILLFILVTETEFSSLSTQPIRRQSSLIAGIFPQKYVFLQRINTLILSGQTAAQK